MGSIQTKMQRQPSILKYHALKGNVDTDMILKLVDVDFVRLNNYAGRIFPRVFARIHHEARYQ